MLIVDDWNSYVTKGTFPGIQTPALDQFAKTAIHFQNAYCAAPVCGPLAGGGVQWALSAHYGQLPQRLGSLAAGTFEYNRDAARTI